MVGWFCLLPLVGLIACSSPPPDTPVIRLVDVFDEATVDGISTDGAELPRTEWRFDGSDHSWKAGPGVAGLTVREGRLVGRATTDVPIVHVERTSRIDDPDTLHAVEVRLRASKGSNLSMELVAAESIDFETATRSASLGIWSFKSPILPSEELQTYTMTASGLGASSRFRHVLLRPTDETGAEFEIESVRLIFRKEFLASIPSGVSWQGLSGIYRETIVTRSTETVRFSMTLPERPWLDLTVGTVEHTPVIFRVGIARAGEDDETILEEQRVTEAHRWQPTPVELGEFAGDEVTLSLSLDNDEPVALGFWGAPAVRNRGAVPAHVGGANPPQGVILILCDSLRRDHLDAYGYERPTAPNLKRMAEEGALFLDNQSQSDFTKVSVPSNLTSLYQSTHGILDIPDRLPSSAVTIAEVYREAGYATWSSAANPFTGKLSNLHQGVEVLHEMGSVELPEGQSDSKNAQAFTDRLLPWLELHRETPFFVFLHVLDPHPPFETYAPYAEQWADPAWRDEHYAEMDKVRPFISAGIRRRLAMAKGEELKKAGIDTDRYVAREIDWYDGSILAVDAEIGRVFDKLRELELEERTVVGFISDHGEEFLDHDMHFNANNLYGEMTNVPLILWGPGRVPSGKVIEETVQSIDLAPTLITLSGLPIPDTMQGQSLVPLMSAEDPNRPEGWRRRPAVSERTRSPALRDPDTANGTAIVWEGWKLIHNKERPEGYPEFELFDHRNDPLNFVNVAAEHPDKVEELKGHLEAWRRWVDTRRLPTDAELTEAVSSEELERLRSLGYVQ